MTVCSNFRLENPHFEQEGNNMAMKNHYATLGISRTETPAGIHARYRDAVRNVYSSFEMAAIEDIEEAHSVLSDPIRRRDHNQSLGSYERDVSQPGMLHNVVFDTEPRSIFADSYAVHPSLEALSNRILRNFTGWHVPKAERPERLSLELILTPEEAMRGGLLSIGIPVDEISGICRQLHVRVPGALKPGRISEVSLQRFGIENLFLELRCRISNELLH